MTDRFAKFQARMGYIRDSPWEYAKDAAQRGNVSVLEKIARKFGPEHLMSGSGKVSCSRAKHSIMPFLTALVPFMHCPIWPDMLAHSR